MFVAVILVHVGRVLARKAFDAGRQAHEAARLLRTRDAADDGRHRRGPGCRAAGRSSAYNRAFPFHVAILRSPPRSAGLGSPSSRRLSKSRCRISARCSSASARSPAPPRRCSVSASRSQFATFIVVMVVSLAALRSRLVGRLGGPGVPSRTEPLIGRQGMVTHDIDPTLGTGRVTVERRGLGGAQHGRHRRRHEGQGRRRRRHRAGGHTHMSGIVLIGMAFVLIIVLMRTIRIVPQKQVKIIERLGKYHRTAEAGLNTIVPFLDSVRETIDLREQITKIEPQPVITRDNVTMEVDAVIYYLDRRSRARDLRGAEPAVGPRAADAVRAAQRHRPARSRSHARRRATPPTRSCAPRSTPRPSSGASR